MLYKNNIDKRNKAFWGTLIGAAVSTIGGILSSKAASDQAKETQAAQWEREDKIRKETAINQNAANMSQSLSSAVSQYNDDPNKWNNLLYRLGGRVNNRLYNYRLGGKVNRKKAADGMLLGQILQGIGSIIPAVASSSSNSANVTMPTTNPIEIKYPNVIKSDFNDINTNNRINNNLYTNNSYNREVALNNKKINSQVFNSINDKRDVLGIVKNGGAVSNRRLRYAGKAKNKATIEAEGNEIVYTPENLENKVTDGGIAQKIADNTYLLRGASHEEQNESGNTGIGLNLNNGIILSDRLRLSDGRTPAEHTLAGESPIENYIKQENKKRELGIKNDISKTSKRKAKYGNFITNNYSFNPYETLLDELKVTANKQPITLQGLQDYNISSRLANDTKLKNNIDYLNLFTPTTGYIFDKPTKWGFVADLLPSLGNAFQGFTNLKLANSLASKKYKHYNITKPIIKVNGPSRIHIGAQLAENERARLREINNIAKNTSNSNVALARMQESNTKLDEERNKLWQFKYNKDTELQNELAKAQAAIDADINKSYDSMMMQQYLEEQKLAQNRDETVANIKGAAYQNFGKGISNIGNAVNNYVNRGYQNYLNSLDMAYLYNSLDEKGRAVFKNIYGDYAPKYSLRYQ